MVWLDICDEQGNAIYFDIHHVERRRIERRWRHSVSGICGNGIFEVEVLVEPGREGAVTFVDLSVGPTMNDRFIDRVDTNSLEVGLLEAASMHCGLVRGSGNKGDIYPHHGRIMSAQVNEAGPIWSSVS
jgi:hypothetical protein